MRFASVHERHVHALKVAGSCWADRQKDMSTEEAQAFRLDFCKKVGARPTTKVSIGP